MLPEQFTNRMKQMLGEEYEDFLKCYESHHAPSLRINGLKGTRQQYEERLESRERELLREQVCWEENGYYYEEPLQPGKHPFHEAGVYYIQEASAMAPAAICCRAGSSMKEPERVLDLCAAPGGKSTQMAAAMQGRGILFCNEIHPARAKILSENVERMGIANAIVMSHEPQTLAKRFPEYFDRILVDAPCSGEGMFRKKEEASLQWSMDNVTMCAQRQDEILECAYQMLQPGGIMVYSTCTFAPDENEGSVSRLLSNHEDMKLLEIPLVGGMEHGKEYGLSKVAEHIERTIRLWPHKLQGEGHFVALIQKEGEKHLKEENGHARIEKAAVSLFESFAKETLCDSWKRERESGAYLMFGEQLYLLPEGTPDLAGLKVLRPGLHLGTIKKQRFEPSHALALYLKKEEVKGTIDLSIEDAVKYIQGYTFPTEKGNGWYLVTVKGYSLGWGKAAAGVLKNHYPKGLRKAL